jgi:hypothetical protein
MGKVDFTPEIRDALGAYTKLVVGAGEFNCFFFDHYPPSSPGGQGVIF